MKSRFSTYIAAFLAALAVPAQLAAQDDEDHKPKHHHYTNYLSG